MTLAVGGMVLTGCGGHDAGSHVAVGSGSPTGGKGGASGRPAGGRTFAPLSSPPCGQPFRSGLQARRLPRTFKVAAVYECESEPQTIPGRGQWQVLVERRATTALGRFDAALRRPEAPPAGPDVACAAVAVTLPRLILVNSAGGLLEPAIPTDECGQPQAQTQQSLNHLPWRTVSHRLLTQIETQPELATGCGPAYKDLFALYASQLQPAKSGPVFPVRRSRLTVCIFRDGHGSNSQVGNFVRGGTIAGATQRAVIDGISKGRSTPGCARPSATFAVLWYVSNGPTATVELGGCDRVLRTQLTIHKSRRVAVQHEEIGQASPTAVRVIESSGR